MYERVNGYTYEDRVIEGLLYANTLIKLPSERNINHIIIYQTNHMIFVGLVRRQQYSSTVDPFAHHNLAHVKSGALAQRKKKKTNADAARARVVRE